jgi:hypothetical protein
MRRRSKEGFERSENENSDGSEKGNGDENDHVT